MPSSNLERLTIRCAIGLSCGAGVACAGEAGGPAEAADSVDSTDSTDSTGSTESTSTSTDSSDASEADGPSAAMTSDDMSSSESSSESEDGDLDSTTADPPADLPPEPIDPNENIPPLDEEGCPGIYAQDLLPTFELTIDPEIWDMLEWEWDHGAAKKKAGEDPNPLHPLELFEYNDIIIDDAMIRLRGNPTWWSQDDKLQFHIDFNENDKKGRFLGLRSLALDAATANRHMLRDRLALSIMRHMGIKAPCANNARVNVNGEYYGIFTSLEKLNKGFLERNFEDPSGDLWYRTDWELETNEDSANTDRLDKLNEADTPKKLGKYLDLEQALRVFAAEAILPDSDGMWAGGYNFYLYDEPMGGKFQMLPWDLDNTFERFDGPPDSEYPANPDPVVWEKWTTHGRPFYDLALEDEDWFDYYIGCIEDQFYAAYDVDSINERIETWTDQIQDSVYEDENKPWSDNEYDDEVDDLYDYVESRAEFLDEWLACWQNGGTPNPEGYCVEF